MLFRSHLSISAALPIGMGMWKISAALALLCAGAVASRAAVGSPIVVLRSVAITAESIPANGIVESNETITCAIELQNAGPRHGTNITATLLGGNGITPITPVQNYGDLPTNGAPVTREFTFTVTTPVGRAAQAQLVVKSDTNEIGRDVFDVPVGDNVTTYTHWQTINIPGDLNASIGPAGEYPSTISVSNLNGTITGVRVTLHNYAHEFPEDVNALLISPLGTNVMLMSDCGGGSLITNVNLTFDSGVTNPLVTLGEIYSATYSATDYNAPNVMEAPAPTTPPYNTSLSQFKRTNPNGDWKLFLYDARPFDVGVLRGGWSLTLTIVKPPRLFVRDNGDGRARLTLSGSGLRAFLIDYSTNLVDWQVFGQTPASADTATFFDAYAGPRRFYRARRTTP